KDRLAMVRGLTFLALAYLWSVPGAFAQAPGEVGNAARTEQAMAWLERLGPALNMPSYQGVFVYARGDQVHSMRIAHRFRDGRVDERLVMQDGGSGATVSRGMHVVCVLPDQWRVRMDGVLPPGRFAEAFTSRLTAFGQWY